ncbi:MAG TPA: AAA family ATPase [Kiritimatiellia bacterium]|nr:AAA family ATPase [Kiritimatiellia bacterium]HRU10249.1 AAA family ATPase [Thermoanaerobaculia bacterium]
MSGKVAAYDGEVRDALRTWQTGNGLTLKQVGARLGKNEGFISKYMNGVPEGDVAAFEQRVKDMLDRERRKRTWADIYFQTEAVAACFTVFELIRESSDIGLVYGPAGVGKSVAVRRYAADHGTVISFVGEEGRGGPYAIQRGIASGIDMRKWSRRECRLSEYIADKLAGSERLVLIDNAQRIDISGLRWLMDFHDATGVSFALVGNPEVIDKLCGRDQLSSRIGIRYDIAQAGITGDWIDRAADEMVAAMWPKAAQEVALLARETARRPGHLRTLSKQLKIAIRLCDTDAFRGKFARSFVEARHLIGADIDGE